MIEYYKSESGDVFFIRTAYALAGFSPKKYGEDIGGAYDSMAAAVCEARKMLCMNEKFTEIMIREEKAWCDSYDEARKLNAFNTLKKSTVSAPIITVNREWANYKLGE